MKTKTKKLLIVLLAVALAFSSLAIAISATDTKASDGGKKINVWLIAGQSNAVGYGEVANYPDGYSDSELLSEGIDNVLFYENSTSRLVPTTFGLGQNNSYSGPEIGIATALKNSGEKHVIVKYGSGDTQISTAGVSASNNISTWTPPSYVKAHPEVSFDGDKIGDLYDGFVSTVISAVAKIKAEGYTPKIQGLYWMQGERDSNHGTMTSDLYSELLRAFISDVRVDLGGIFGEDLSAMPVVFGRVYCNPEYTPNSATGLAAVQAAQDAVAADTTLKNVAMINTTTDLRDPVSGDAKAPVQQDKWHYDTLSQQMIGEAAVRKILGKKSANIGIVSTTPVAIGKGEQALYSATVNYVVGGKITMKLGGYELFTIADGTFSLLSANIKGNYMSGDYHVSVSVNPEQNMTMVEVTLPDGGIVRRGANDKHNGNAVAIYALDANRVKSVDVSYETLVLNEYEIVTLEPMADGFGANVYNLVTSFADAASTRLFAWTAKADFIGSRTMAVKYRVKGTAEWTVVDAYKLTEPTEYAPEDYFKADVEGLLANNEYEYKIGVKGSPDEVNEWSKSYFFTTASGDEKEFTFIAVGDTQGITWAGTETANKGYIYTKAAYDEALEEVSNPAFILHTGDLVEEGLKTDQWNLYFKALGEAGATIPHFATPGNHDDNLSSSNQNFNFGLHLNHPDNGGNAALDPTVVAAINSLGADETDAAWVKLLIKYMDETFYSYNYGDAHFIVYNSGAYSSKDELMMKAQRAWLKADLEANKDAKWTIVLAHQANYHLYGGAYSRSTLADILEGFDVDLVIQGHSHLVTRTYPIKDGKIVTKENPNVVTKGDGTVYMLIGATALNHDPINYKGYTNMETHAVAVTNVGVQPTYSVFNVTEDSIKVTVKQVNGLVLDEFTIVESEEEKENDGNLVYNDNFKYYTYSDLSALGIWETIQKLSVTTNGYSYYPATAPSYSSERIKLTDGQGVQFNWVKLIGGVDNYSPDDTYVFEFDAIVKSLGNGKDNNPNNVSSSQCRALFVAFGGFYNQIGLDVGTNKTSNNTQVGAGPKHQYAYTGNDTFHIRIELRGTTTYCTLTDNKGTTLTGTRNETYYANVETDLILQSMTFRCEDGESYIDNFKFEVIKNTYINGYGNLPSTYHDEEKYPILVFQNNEVVGAYASNQFVEAMAKAREFSYNTKGIPVKVLLRGDVTAIKSTAYENGNDQNLGMALGIIDVNLNGFTVTQIDNTQLFFARTKTYSATDNDITLNVHDGNIVIVGNLLALGTQTNGAYDKYKSGNINFTNVNISVAEGAPERLNFLAHYTNGTTTSMPNATVKYNIVFKDCIFNLSNMPLNCTVFNFNNTESNGNTAADVKINGGEIILSKNNVNSTLYNVNSISTVSLGEGSDGEYLKITAPSGKTAGIRTNNTFTKDGKAAAFLTSKTQAGMTTYTLETELYIDGYGPVSLDKADEAKYPILVFQNGALVEAYAADKFTDAITKAGSSVGKAGAVEAKVLLRGNVTATSNYQNLGLALAPIDVNLNGFTVTQTDSTQLFFARTKTTSATDTDMTLNVHDGNIVIKGNLLALGAQTYGAYGKFKSGNINFTNVNITAAEGSSERINFLAHFTNGSTDAIPNSTVKYNIVFKDCIFNLSNMPLNCTVFNFNNTASNGNTAADVKINGGEIIFSKNNVGSTIYNVNSYSTVSFGEGRDGECLKVTVPEGEKASVLTNNTLSINGAAAAFVSPATVLGNTTYTLRSEFYIDGYGNVSAAYSNPAEYPILVFQNGALIEAYAADKFTEAMTGARTFADAKGDTEVKVLLRGNVTSVKNDQNLGAALAPIDVNLNGFTVTQTDGTQLFFARTKTYSATDTDLTLNVHDGNIVIKGNLLGLGTQSNGAYEKYKSGNINFTNVNITVAYGASPDGVIAHYSNGSLPIDKPVEYSIVFENCVFDLTNATSASVLFNFNNTSDNPSANSVEINGGEIILGSTTANVTLYNVNENSSVIFGKGDSGSYTKIVVSSRISSSTVSNKVTIDSGAECIFKKASDNGEYATYTLYPEVMIDYKIKSSVTLHSGLVYNIYIPVANLSGFTVNGNTCEYEAVELDGVEYYKVSVDLPAKKALSDINLKVNLKSGDGEVSATWTLSLVKYAEKVIGDTNAAEAKLVSDILSYARAAYDYFGISDADKTSKVNALLGENYDENNAPSMNGSADVPSVGLKSATFVLNATPAVRFYLADGADASKYTFFADGKKLDFTEGSDSNGAYVEISVFAYLMGKTVEYRIDGIASGSYHIKSYYEFAKTQDNAKLVTLVERFAKYCESAEEYRLSVVSK